MKTRQAVFSETSSLAIMHPQTIFTAMTVLALSVGQTLALPEAIPELETSAQCHPGEHLVGSGCAPSQKGHTSCSANKHSVVSTLSPLRQAASRLDQDFSR